MDSYIFASYATIYSTNGCYINDLTVLDNYVRINIILF